MTILGIAILAIAHDCISTIYECLQYGLPFKIDYHKKIQNGLPFQIIIRKVVYFEDINCLKWTTITSL